MPVLGRNAGMGSVVKGAVKEIENQVIDINKTIKNSNVIKTNSKTVGSLTIYSKNNMVWWKKQSDATLYRLRLFIDGNEIDVIEIDRAKAYHTFNDLVGTGYVVKLEIEDRNGKVSKSIEIKI